MVLIVFNYKHDSITSKGLIHTYSSTDWSLGFYSFLCQSFYAKAPITLRTLITLISGYHYHDNFYFILFFLHLSVTCFVLQLLPADSVQTDSVETSLMVTADVGDNVTLDCLRLQKENNVPIVWYKQKVGHVPHIMVAVQQQPSYEYGYKPPKFSIEEEKRNLLTWTLQMKPCITVDA